MPPLGLYYMSLNLITLATVKTNLGISDTSYDAAITAQIPIVSNDVRRILNNNFDKAYIAAFDDSGTNIDFGIINNDIYQKQDRFRLGQIVTHPNLPDETYLTDFNPLTGYYTLSATPTDTGDYVIPTIEISQQLTISRMIWYRIDNLSTSAANKKEVKSISYGSVSKTFSDGEINGKWNYPQKLIDALGKPFAKVGF